MNWNFRKSRFWGVGLVILGVFMLVFCSTVHAAFPEKPIEIVVPYDPGGSSDLSLRAITPILSEILNVPIMVSNKPGGNGLTGAAYVKNSKPDGYTLAYLGGRPSIPEIYQKEYPYTSKDFTPIAQLVSTDGALVVHSDLNIKTLDEFVEYIEGSKDAVKFGHTGRGNTPYLTGILLRDTYNLNLSDIPYKGDAGAMTAILRKEVPAVFVNCMAALPQMEAGNVRVLAVLSEKRLQAAPDVLTFRETKYPLDTNILTFIGIFGPKDIPEEVVKIIAKAIEEAQRDERFIKRITEIGMNPVSCSLQSFGERVKDFGNSLGPILQKLNLVQ